MTKHTSGRSTLWHTSPTATARGYESTRWKSARVRLSPSPSMMTPSAMGRRLVITPCSIAAS